MDDLWMVTIRLRVDVHDLDALIAAAGPGPHPQFEYPTNVQSALQKIIEPPGLDAIPGVSPPAVGWLASVEAAAVTDGDSQ
jgi:hypothetical protein